jgi:hypothetical protein
MVSVAMTETSEVAMQYRWRAVPLVAAVALAACGDEGPNPDNGGGAEDTAARFEELADSVDGEGWSPTAEALRHAAKIVRLAGGATPVTLTIDGEARRFDAVAEQLDFPNIVCSWPDSAVAEPSPPEGEGGGVSGGGGSGGEGGCEEVGTWSMRTLIAWEPETMAEVVRIVADLGSTEVEPGVPDVMTGLPTNSSGGAGADPGPETPDSAVGEFPGFLGEYLVDDVGIYFAAEGTQSNDLLGPSGSCTDGTVVLDWARFRCEAARFSFAVDMRVEQLRTDPLPSPAPPVSPERHDIALASTDIDGVRLKVVEWIPPDPPMPVDPPPGGPPPVDSVPPEPSPPPVDPPPGSPPVDSLVSE